MKRIISLLCLIAICFCLSSCDPSTFVVTAESLENVTSIELISYSNTEQKHFNSWVPNHFEDLVDFDNSRATVIENLEEEKIPEFIAEFTKTDILHTYYAYDSPNDVCIRLVFSNGNYLIIWADYNQNSHAGYIGEYMPDGKVLSFWGSFSSLHYYKDLVNNFFDYNI